jgi:hypothetical protein
MTRLVMSLNSLIKLGEFKSSRRRGAEVGMSGRSWRCLMSKDLMGDIAIAKSRD